MVLKPTPHVSGLSYDVVEIFVFGHYGNADKFVHVLKVT